MMSVSRCIQIALPVIVLGAMATVLAQQLSPTWPLIVDLAVGAFTAAAAIPALRVLLPSDR